MKNPGIKDFRDPKVMWYAREKKWIMTLATKDRITFYSSLNLKSWKKESEFGQETSAHGGVWECPDLFPLKLNSKTYWVLIVNVNPGGPNSGSATQYFIGQFDGSKFTASDTATKWLDYGPDEYAGITWNNTGNRKIFLGWMSNWLYANEVPTSVWRNAMTIPRELKLKTYKGSIIIVSVPVKEIGVLKLNTLSLNNINLQKGFDLNGKTGKASICFILNLDADELKSYAIVLSNTRNEKVTIGFDKAADQYFIDRSHSGNVGFNKDFGRKYIAPRLSASKSTRLTLLVDASSVELFADGGATVMTSVFFPHEPFSKINMQSSDSFVIKTLTYSPLQSIWQK